MTADEVTDVLGRIGIANARMRSAADQIRRELEAGRPPGDDTP
jgi:hypothetical protein